MERYGISFLMHRKGLPIFILQALIGKMDLKICVVVFVLKTACSQISLVVHVDVELSAVVKIVN